MGEAAARLMRRVLAAAALAAALACAPHPLRAQGVPAGTLLRNVAAVNYTAAGVPRAVASNEVTLRVEPAATSAAITLARYAAGTSAAGSGFSGPAGPTACRSGASLVDLPAPFVAGQGNLDPSRALPLAGTDTVHAGDALFVRVVDRDQNRDASLVEYVEVRVTARTTGDSELLRLRETGADSGEFIGYVATRLASSAQANCQLDVTRDSPLDVAYVDPLDARDAVQAAGLVDPQGVVFDSQSGARLDGARVRLLDAVTGQPAVVYGDDGVSRYPAEMVTGQPVTDAGGTVYVLPRGLYRFPLVQPGRYRLAIDPPAGYTFTSSVTVDVLQKLQGAPFRLAPASFGQQFVVAAPVIAAVDVPLDPGSTALSLAKRASVQVAAVGDLIAWDLELANGSAAVPLRGIVLHDALPEGLRLKRGSVRIEGRAAADPLVAPGGRELRFALGDVRRGGRLHLRYVTEVTVVARGRELVNVARADGQWRGLERGPGARATAQRAVRRPVVHRRTRGGGRVHAPGRPGARRRGRTRLPRGRPLRPDRPRRQVPLRGSRAGHARGADGCGDPARGHERDVVQSPHVPRCSLIAVRRAARRGARAGRLPSRAGAANSAGSALRMLMSRPRQLRRCRVPPARPGSTGGQPLPRRPATRSPRRPGPAPRPPRPSRDRGAGAGRALPRAGGRRDAADREPQVALVHAPGQRVQLRVNGEPVSVLNYDGARANAARTLAPAAGAASTCATAITSSSRSSTTARAVARRGSCATCTTAAARCAPSSIARPRSCSPTAGSAR
ncbi:MAG: carboxypeptidase-like regulatory domain-containing protein [Steroidobacteraceae bacterium]